MKKSLIADCTLLFVALIWGATFVVVQNAISFLDPVTFNAIRFFIASGCLLLWLILFHREQLRALSWKFIGSGCLMGLVLFLGYALQTIGLVYTSTSKAGFITGLNVVLVPLLGIFLLKQRPTLQALTGVSIATVGLYLLTMGDKVSINKGDILVFFCAISFALHIIFTGKFTSKYPTLLLTVTQLLVVSFLCSIYSFLFENWHEILDIGVMGNREVVIALIITSLLATAFAFFAQTMFQKDTTPTRVALIFVTEPVFAAITGYIWAGDRLSSIAIFGCFFILIGMVLAEVPLHKKKEAKRIIAS